MTILLTPARTAHDPYITKIIASLNERGHSFIPIALIPPVLVWYRLMRSARTLCCTTYAAKIIMTLPARLLGMRVFWIETRLVDRTLTGRLRIAFYRTAARWATIVVTTNAIRQQLTRIGISTEIIHHIPPGITVDTHGVQRSLFTSIAERKSKRRMGFAIGTLSSLDQEKGIEHLLQGFKIARESIPDLHLTIVGHGPQKNALQWLAKKIGVSEYVIFVGWQENVERWFANFDLIIAPAIRKEGFGEFLLVAMAYGKPIIATDVGSFPEIIERRKTGVIIEAGNATMLSEAIVNLYHHPEWREEMGKRARERVEEYFSLARMVNAWDVLLRHEK